MLKILSYFMVFRKKEKDTEVVNRSQAKKHVL